MEDTQGTYLFWKEYTNQVKTANPDAFSVGEAWTNTETILNYVKDDRIDYCFEFDLAGNIMYSVNEGKADNLYKQLQKMYTIYPHLQYGTFLANHDQNRIMNSFGMDENKVKLAAAIYLTLPGIPYIFYGEEIGMIGEKPDENIRRPMQWNSQSNAGFTTGTPWNSLNNNYPTFNVEKEAIDASSLLTTYKKLIQLRNQEKALQIGTYEPVSTNQNKVFAFLRQHNGEDVLVIHNTGTSVIRDLNLDLNNTNIANGAYILLDRLADDSPTNIELSGNKMDLGFMLSGRGTKVYKFVKTVATELVDNQSFVKIFPNPVGDELRLEITDLHWKKTDYTINDIQGRIVASGRVDLSTQQAIITTDFLIAGMYQLRLRNGDLVQQLSFVKGE